MKKIRFIIGAIGAAVLAAGIANALPPTYALALHPQCAVTANRVYYTGAVATADEHAPVAGARVRVKYGDAVRTGTTDVAGIYHVDFPRTAATVAREISTEIETPTGSLLPLWARESSSECRVPTATIGALREVSGHAH